jgi:MerR family copper efflux transcriptional regulator
MSTFTIGEASERSGFSASALRYYEGIGLVVPTGRTDAGYRMYDDAALARLAFIGRAKELGCSLEEITDLVAIWDGERCGPVQRRFHELVTTKIDEAERQVRSLTELRAQLRRAASQLSGPALDGPCDDTCACVGASAAARGDRATIPIACTLDDAEVGGRVDAWRAILAASRARTTTADGTVRVHLDGTDRLPGLAELVAAEQDCCAFFSFTITVDHVGVTLEVRAPDGAAPIVDELFGAPA